MDKTVFISYRREKSELALLVLNDLRANGFDTFLDLDSTGSGDFAKIILRNVASRTHFIVLLTFGCLDRCDKEGDLFRQEIEAAIDSRRNIVLLTDSRFDFGSPEVKARLVGKLRLLARYNVLPLPHPPTPVYLAVALEMLRTQYLSKSLDEIVHPEPEASSSPVEEDLTAAPSMRPFVPVPVPVTHPSKIARQPAVGAQPDARATLDFAGTAVIVLAHAPIASALVEVARIVGPERRGQVFAIDVDPTTDIEALVRELASLVSRLQGHSILVLTDVFGATPTNAVMQILKASVESVVVLAGVNVPMMWRTMAYIDLPLAELAERAMLGGSQGIMRVRI